MTAVKQIDVINRALQKLGVDRIASLTELSAQAVETTFSYDFLRRAELRRNVWRFSIRNVAIRALNLVTQRVTFAAWAVGTTYDQNDIISGSDGEIYISLVGSNTGNDPTVSGSAYWTRYIGNLYANQFIVAWSSVTTYAVNQYALGSNGTTYVSLVNSNLNNDPTTDNGTNWAVSMNNTANTSYWAGELVYVLGTTTVYLSVVSNNGTNPTTDTTGSWQAMTSTPSLSLVNIVYPLGTGPDTETNTRNVFFLPYGYLREAPQAPKAQVGAFLGGPAGLRFDDWNFENNVFTSWDPGPIIFRFAADVTDASQFDPLFVEGLACRIGVEHYSDLTRGVDTKIRITDIEGMYKKFMGEARTVNGIETGPTDPPLDEYISVRM